MGGRSHSSMAAADHAIVFTGALSLANNGGFAQVRAEVSPRDLRGSSGVALRVRGDGRTYRLTVRQDGTTYDAEFPTSAGQWTTAQIHWSEMRMNRRGQRPPAPPPNPHRITALGFLIGDGIPGLFRLEIGAIEVQCREPGPGNPDRSPGITFPPR